MRAWIDAAAEDAHYVDVTNNGKPVGGKSGVESYKIGWTDDKPAVPAAD
ncbi:hypothetical protein [Nonomuraea sp. NPDC049784]